MYLIKVKESYNLRRENYVQIRKKEEAKTETKK